MVLVCQTIRIGKLDGNETTKYDIRIEDEPSGARLSDYIRVGEVKELQATKFGLALASIMPYSSS